VPGEPRRWRAAPLAGALVPAGLLGLGVGLAVGTSFGPRLLADLASFGTPLLAGCAGVLLRHRRAWLAPLAAAGLYALAWLDPGHLPGQAAAAVLIGGACLAAAALLASLASRGALVAGLVLLVVVDVVLVWLIPQVGPATTVLHGTAPPHVRLGGLQLHAPALQDVTFGSALMGWLDLLAPAVLGLAVRGRGRRPAAAATALAALAWGNVLWAVTLVPATVPVLAGLASTRGRRLRRAAMESPEQH